MMVCDARLSRTEAATRPSRHFEAFCRLAECKVCAPVASARDTLRILARKRPFFDSRTARRASNAGTAAARVTAAYSSDRRPRIALMGVADVHHHMRATGEARGAERVVEPRHDEICGLILMLLYQNIYFTTPSETAKGTALLFPKPLD